MGRQDYFKDERAVSETVGFILIFGIVMAGIGLVTLYGYPALMSQQSEANIRNMEKNLIVLQSDVNTLAYKSVPYKETTMQVSGGVLSVEKPNDYSYFSIENNGNSLIPALDGEIFRPGNLRFLSDSGDVAVALENGAVVKWQIGATGQGYEPSVMLSNPRWFIDTTGGVTTLVITLIQVDSTTPLAKSGISAVQMGITPLVIFNPDGIPENEDDSNFKEYFPVVGPVQISITTSDRFYKAWANYFEYDLGMTTSDDITWTKSGIDRVIIKAWKINVINL
ncbi:MAG: DUF7289 family protein [Methanolinea sp.]